jgi:C4-dicarboxylate-specific signal transduction histidine kinase
MKERLAILGRLGVGAAHDLEHDLGVIEESLRLIKWHGLGTEPRIAFEEARDALRHAIRLTRSMRAYGPRMPPDAVPTNLVLVVRRTLACFAGVLPATVRVVVDVADELPLVRGDAEDLELLVLDTMLYAADRVPADGWVDVSLQRNASGDIAFEVAHSGPLAPPAALGADASLGFAQMIAERTGARVERFPRAGGGTRCVVTFAQRES